MQPAAALIAVAPAAPRSPTASHPKPTDRSSPRAPLTAAVGILHRDRSCKPWLTAPIAAPPQFRRTDCHFSITAEAGYDRQRDCYVPSKTFLLEAKDGRVCLDMERPRVCIRVRERRESPDLTLYLKYRARSIVWPL